MTFDDILGSITGVEIIGRGLGVHVRHYLNQHHGQGRWRKLKGFASVQYPDGSVWWVEIHWYEASGIGRRDPKDKRKIRRIK